jgi:ankyrin repeat protein
MGCGASTGSATEQMKLHSKIRWFNKDESNDEKEVRLNEIISLLSSMEVPDKQNGNAALHIAAQNGHFEVVDLLISKGAKLSAKNRGGNTRKFFF